MTPKRFGIFLGLNVVVSLAVTLGVLWLWQNFSGARVLGPQAGTAVSTEVVLTTPGSQATAAPTQAGGPVHYTVQAGDTLSSIATHYNVSIEDIMTANGLSNPNVLTPGQQLLIPVGGLPSPTPTSSVPVTPPAPIDTATAPPSGTPLLKIASVTGAGTVATEAVLIVNDGGTVRLDGWKLSDGKGNTYTFPSLALFGGGAVTVHTVRGDNKPADLYWGHDASVWPHGATVILQDASDNVQATYSVP